ncbi:MAG: hypothetical protein LBT68_01115 [Spirochaetales bacterium]|jgi:hypothetical protein|nr:hypothetical protein [Spirochaetales bacterium]
MRKLFGNETSGPGILNYHSSREERIAMSPQLTARYCKPVVRPRGLLGRLFGSNKGTRLTFLNILLLFFFIIVYQTAMSQLPGRTWSSEGFQFSLSAFARGDRTFVSLRITKEKNSGWKGLPPEVTLESGGSSEFFTPNLPLKNGEITFVRTVLPRPESKKVSCTIAFAGATKKITVGVKEE